MNTTNSKNFTTTYALISKCRENKIQQKRNKRNHTHIFFLLVAIAMSTCMAMSCSTSKDKYSFSNYQDAIDEYHAFLGQLQVMGNVSTKDLASIINQWSELKDTVYNYIGMDSCFHSHNWLVTQYTNINDSIRIELLRCCTSRSRNIRDVLFVKENTDLPIEDNLTPTINKARSFFLSLDSVMVKPIDAAHSLSSYRNFLKQEKQNNTASERELHDFLLEEDKIFRSFLMHIKDYSDQDLTDITLMTEEVCNNICQNAVQNRANTKDIVVHLAMRANRRLLQNTDTCLTDIEKKASLNDAQKTAYFWMIAQPFISIDRFGFALLDNNQKEHLSLLAERFAKAQSSNAFDVDNPSMERICEMMLKLYISTL